MQAPFLSCTYSYNMKILKSFNLHLFDKLFLSAIILNVFSYFLFEKTLINLTIILGIFIFGVLVFIPFRKLKKFKELGLIESMFYFSIIIGTYLTFSFLGINYLLSSEQVDISNYRVKCKVNKVFTLNEQTDKTTVVKAEFNDGFYKRINLSKEFRHQIKHPDSIEIHLSTGFFGYPIIKRIGSNKTTKIQS